jgi:protein-S-isoprenylcysteine O-methyltransferase Ste14
MDLPFRITVIALVYLGKIIRSRYQRRTGREKIRDGLRRHRRDTVLVLIMSVLWQGSLLIYVLVPRWIGWADLGWPAAVRWSGLALGLAIHALFVWAHEALGRNFSGLLQIREDHRLVTHGPYRWIRHPIYTYALLLAVSVFLLSGNWFVGALWIGSGLVVFALRIPEEEAELIEAFGDEYLAYRARTGRLLPRLMR